MSNVYKKCDCGKHWSVTGGECSKCLYFAKLDRAARRAGFASEADRRQEAARRDRLLGPPLP